MTAINPYCEEEFAYSISFRQVRRVESGGTPPPGRFETTGRAKLSRMSRHSRQSNGAAGGIHQRGADRACR